MFIVGTRAAVADNSGAQIAGTIKLLGGSKRRFSKTGALIRVAIKKAIPNGKVKAGEVPFAVIARTKKKQRRADGSYIRFDRSAVVLLNKQLEPLGTRVFGPMPRELKNFSTRIASLAPEVI